MHLGYITIIRDIKKCEIDTAIQLLYKNSLNSYRYLNNAITDSNKFPIYIYGIKLFSDSFSFPIMIFHILSYIL